MSESRSNLDLKLQSPGTQNCSVGMMSRKLLQYAFILSGKILVVEWRNSIKKMILMPTFVTHNFILTLTLLPYVSFMFTDLNSCFVSSESLNGPKNQESDGDLTDDVFESHGEDFKVRQV